MKNGIVSNINEKSIQTFLKNTLFTTHAFKSLIITNQTLNLFTVSTVDRIPKLYIGFFNLIMQLLLFKIVATIKLF